METFIYAAKETKKIWCLRVKCEYDVNTSLIKLIQVIYKKNHSFTKNNFFFLWIERDQEKRMDWMGKERRYIHQKIYKKLIFWERSQWCRFVTIFGSGINSNRRWFFLHRLFIFSISLIYFVMKFILCFKRLQMIL